MIPRFPCATPPGFSPPPLSLSLARFSSSSLPLPFDPEDLPVRKPNLSCNPLFLSLSLYHSAYLSLPPVFSSPRPPPSFRHELVGRIEPRSIFLFFFATPRRARRRGLARKSNFASAFLPLSRRLFPSFCVSRAVSRHAARTDRRAEIRVRKSQVRGGRGEGNADGANHRPKIRLSKSATSERGRFLSILRFQTILRVR